MDKKLTAMVLVDGGASYWTTSLKEARKDRSARLVHEYRDGKFYRTVELNRAAEIARMGS